MGDEKRWSMAEIEAALEELQEIDACRWEEAREVGAEQKALNGNYED